MYLECVSVWWAQECQGLLVCGLCAEPVRAQRKAATKCSATTVWQNLMAARVAFLRLHFRDLHLHSIQAFKVVNAIKRNPVLYEFVQS